MKIAFPDSVLARRCIPALVAVGGSLAALPAAALELGDLSVHSKLGQPLRASIAYVLAPNEQLSELCISLHSGQSFVGLPNVARASVSIANGVIKLTGNTPLREPMIAVRISVNCPYTANVSREYTLFIDPETRVDTPPVTAPVAASTVSRRAALQHEFEESARYQVQAGDSLSKIVQRIENRSLAFWPAVNAIFAANPDSFMDGDPNKLKAGSWLSIPDFDAGEPVRAVTTVIAEPEVTPVPALALESGSAPAVTLEPAVTFVADQVVEEFPDTGVTTGDLKPGDFILDTQLTEPVTTSSLPNVPTAIIRNAPQTTNNAQSSSWLMWLAGSGIAIISALLLFGRRLRHGTGTTPVAPHADQSRRRITDVDDEHGLSVDSPTVENLALDADLIIGTGLAEGIEVELVQNFGFTETTGLDIELPFDAHPVASDETDIIAPLRIEESSILKAEVLPENDDYDMSVIMDATKMPRPEDVTGRDLQAVAVDVSDDSAIVENYTISQEVDYQIIEQDYEDEMTATRALSEEIARAAAEVTGLLDADESTDDETAALPLASVTELDITVQLPQPEAEISDLDDTGINEAVTVKLSTDDKTAEMPVADNDGDTVEMPAKSGKSS